MPRTRCPGCLQWGKDRCKCTADATMTSTTTKKKEQPDATPSLSSASKSSPPDAEILRLTLELQKVRARRLETARELIEESRRADERCLAVQVATEKRTE